MIARKINPLNIPKMHERREYSRKLQSKQVCQAVEDFIGSNMISIEVIDNEGLWANSNNFRRSFQRYVDDHRLRSRIIVTIRGNRVFLIKKGLR